MRQEFIKIKDPNARAWKMKTSILGPKHETPKPDIRTQENWSQPQKKLKRLHYTTQPKNMDSKKQ